jgi:hypothetical protein
MPAAKLQVLVDCNVPDLDQDTPEESHGSNQVAALTESAIAAGVMSNQFGARSSSSSSTTTSSLVPARLPRIHKKRKS